jgi:hypothetical protein
MGASAGQDGRAHVLPTPSVASVGVAEDLYHAKEEYLRQAGPDSSLSLSLSLSLSSSDAPSARQENEEWVLCDSCAKWRTVPSGFQFDRDKSFFCDMIEALTCDTPEEQWDGKEQFDRILDDGSNGRNGTAPRERERERESARARATGDSCRSGGGAKRSGGPISKELSAAELANGKRKCLGGEEREREGKGGTCRLPHADREETERDMSRCMLRESFCFGATSPQEREHHSSHVAGSGERDTERDTGAAQGGAAAVQGGGGQAGEELVGEACRAGEMVRVVLSSAAYGKAWRLACLAREGKEGEDAINVCDGSESAAASLCPNAPKSRACKSDGGTSVTASSITRPPKTCRESGARDGGHEVLRDEGEELADSRAVEILIELLVPKLGLPPKRVEGRPPSPSPPKPGKNVNRRIFANAQGVFGSFASQQQHAQIIQAAQDTQ